jgi:hypothetical protein
MVILHATCDAHPYEYSVQNVFVFSLGSILHPESFTQC